MKGYIIKRAIYTLITLYLISTLTFVLFQVMSPVDPIAIYCGKAYIIEPTMRERLIARFGLNESLLVRYVKYTVNTFTFDFGISISSQVPVSRELAIRIGPTLLLGGLALVITALVGILMGVLAAIRKGTTVDFLAIGAGLVAWGVPSFFFQLLFLLIFGVALGWFPITGMLTPPPPPFLSLNYVSQVLHHITLPLITIVLIGFGFFALYTRNLVIDTLAQDFIVTARAKGLSERAVVFKHALRATLPPIVSMFVLAIPMMFWLVTMAEIIFGWPGIGLWFMEASMDNDYAVVQTVIFLYSILILLGNFVTDLLYGWLDPRIRVGGVRR